VKLPNTDSPILAGYRTEEDFADDCDVAKRTVRRWRMLGLPWVRRGNLILIPIGRAGLAGRRPARRACGAAPARGQAMSALATMPACMTADDWMQTANEETRACQRDAESSIRHAIAAGRALAEAKRQFGHGDWSSYLETHYDYRPRTAQQFMHLAKRLDAMPELEQRAIEVGSIHAATHLLDKEFERLNPKRRAFDGDKAMQRAKGAMQALTAILDDVLHQPEAERDDWLEGVRLTPEIARTIIEWFAEAELGLSG
jgi:hypothetical protein